MSALTFALACDKGHESPTTEDTGQTQTVSTSEATGQVGTSTETGTVGTTLGVTDTADAATEGVTAETTSTATGTNDTFNTTSTTGPTSTTGTGTDTDTGGLVGESCSEFDTDRYQSNGVFFDDGQTLTVHVSTHKNCCEEPVTVSPWSGSAAVLKISAEQLKIGSFDAVAEFEMECIYYFGSYPDNDEGGEESPGDLTATIDILRISDGEFEACVQSDEWCDIGCFVATICD